MPEISKISLEEKQRAASAIKKCDIQEVIERGRYYEDDFKNVKDLMKDTADITDKYGDIITFLSKTSKEGQGDKKGSIQLPRERGEEKLGEEKS